MVVTGVVKFLGALRDFRRGTVLHVSGVTGSVGERDATMPTVFANRLVEPSHRARAADGVRLGRLAALALANLPPSIEAFAAHVGPVARHDETNANAKRKATRPFGRDSRGQTARVVEKLCPVGNIEP